MIYTIYDRVGGKAAPVEVLRALPGGEVETVSVLVAPDKRDPPYRSEPIRPFEPEPVTAEMEQTRPETLAQVAIEPQDEQAQPKEPKLTSHREFVERWFSHPDRARKP